MTAPPPTRAPAPRRPQQQQTGSREREGGGRARFGSRGVRRRLGPRAAWRCGHVDARRLGGRGERCGACAGSPLRSPYPERAAVASSGGWRVARVRRGNAFRQRGCRWRMAAAGPSPVSVLQSGGRTLGFCAAFSGAGCKTQRSRTVLLPAPRCAPQMRCAAGGGAGRAALTSSGVFTLLVADGARRARGCFHVGPSAPLMVDAEVWAVAA